MTKWIKLRESEYAYLNVSTFTSIEVTGQGTVYQVNAFQPKGYHPFFHGTRKECNSWLEILITLIAIVPNHDIIELTEVDAKHRKMKINIG